MKEAARLEKLYSSIVIRILRWAIVLCALFLLFRGFENIQMLRLSLFLLGIFCMEEVFFHYYTGKRMPSQTVSQASDFSFEICTKEAAQALLEHDSVSCIRSLFHASSVKFLLDKMVIDPHEITVQPLSLNDIGSQAFELSKQTGGTYITRIDLVAAYLLVTEPTTKLLFQKKLKPEDLRAVLAWTRTEFSEEEQPKKTRVRFTGEGLGENWVSGWTLETKKYTRAFDYQYFTKRPLLAGREHEFDTMVEALSRKTNNNVLLIGEAGTGKENLVKALALDSARGLLSKSLNYKTFLELLVGPLLVGVSDKGELEKRLQDIIEEVSHGNSVVLFIPEFQHILGSSSFNLDISGAIYPYLQNGKLPIVATITPENYKTYVEKNPIQDVFEGIEIQEPDKNIALKMLLEKVTEIENQNNVKISYRPVLAALDYANQYLQDHYLPGSAVALLSDTAHSIAIDHHRQEKILTDDDVIQKVESKTHVRVGTPSNDEKQLLLHMEDTLHKRLIGQDDAIHAIAEAIRRVRAGMATQTRPISFLFLGPTGVGKTETAKVLSETYYGGEQHMIRFDMSEYRGTDGMNRLLGSPSSFDMHRGELTERVHDNPYSLVLLDEFEKADRDILNLFLQVFEDGRLTDSHGKTVSFVNTIIIATSNAGSEFIREHIQTGTTTDTLKKQLLEYLQSQGIFTPELLNRFDDIVTFTPLSSEQLTAVVKLLLMETVEKLKKQDITINYDDTAVAAIAKNGFDPQFGARPMRRYIQDNVEDMLAKKILDGSLSRGNTVMLSALPNGTISCVVQQ